MIVKLLGIAHVGLQDVQRFVSRHLLHFGVLVTKLSKVPVANSFKISALRAPDIVSLRAMYTRRRTLYEHQQLARIATGFGDLTDAAERVLNGQLRREADVLVTVERSDAAIQGRI